MELLLLLAVVGGAIYLISTRARGGSRKQLEQEQLDDALADAKRWTDRLGSQVLNLAGTDTASTQAMADASERFTAASAALADARTVKQAHLARESALEGLHYVNAAREIMGMPPGPPLSELEGQRRAGRVTEQRTVTQEDGTEITASPTASEQTPHYYPGGSVAGRPVPAGWYSSAWWAPAMMTGMWAASSMMFYSAMFAGMAGTPSAAEFEAGDAGADAGADMGDAGDAGADAGDAGGDFGGDAGGDGGFFGGDFGGDGGFDFGGFDF
ncbi:hypothetical protein [Corynebacterium lipophiloflavum]|uniref:DUF1542 domain-containing protein n=1 Tax=Corynebacterium lipophiloflavum (strain ATCC 700352 / DSM 44291 / CCUG 37336 / JCM 10383 / DMMZ 1944) TaxID=525263 RepID=C0XRF5_CORLD|nr:hypothetical protein [Corynebacterium lipophiloflavum]EEI17188.1 hypothetical protein HMPREF0298_1025 [Corynebacterium lipophiloflavum DSM 44291]